jgi:hypothetical protein
MLRMRKKPPEAGAEFRVSLQLARPPLRTGLWARALPSLTSCLAYCGQRLARLLLGRDNRRGSAG